MEVVSNEISRGNGKKIFYCVVYLLRLCWEELVCVVMGSCNVICLLSKVLNIDYQMVSGR